MAQKGSAVMNRRKIKILAALAAMACSSCAEKWAKPGASEQEFVAMESDCSARAYRSFPPVLQRLQLEPGYYTQPQFACEYRGPFERCFQVDGEYIPPVITTVDANDAGRNANIRSCFFEHGWRPKSN